MDSTEREVDSTYLAQLEAKLKNLKSPDKLTGKAFLSDMASFKDHQLFHLMTLDPSSSGFEDNFVSDAPITPNYIQKKIAPQTCAINKEELAKLLKHDLLQEHYDDFMNELGEVRKELAEEPNSSEVGEEDSPASSTETVSDCGLPGTLEGDIYGGLSKEDYDEFMQELDEMRQEMAGQLRCSADDDERSEDAASTKDLSGDTPESRSQ